MAEKILLYPELETWLGRATEDLIPEAAASVREEIARHFEDAVRDGLAAGLPEIAAINLALPDLGSPRRAHRRLRREWLTVAELQSIKAMVERRRDLPSLKHRFVAILRIFGAIWLAIAAYSVFAMLSIDNGGWEAVAPVLIVGAPVCTVTLILYGTGIYLASVAPDAFIIAELIKESLWVFWFVYWGLIPVVRDIAFASIFPGHSLDSALFGWIWTALCWTVLVWEWAVRPARLWLKVRRARLKRSPTIQALLGAAADVPQED